MFLDRKDLPDVFKFRFITFILWSCMYVKVKYFPSAFVYVCEFHKVGKDVAKYIGANKTSIYMCRLSIERFLKSWANMTSNGSRNF